MKMFCDEPVLPCPFCGGEPEIGIVADPASMDHGGHYIQCTNDLCCASVGLIFACGDDPDPLLVERWNARIVPAGEIRRLHDVLREIISLDHHNHGPESRATKIARLALTGGERE